MTVAAAAKLKKLMYILSKSVPYKPSNIAMALSEDGIIAAGNSIPIWMFGFIY